MSSVNNRQVNGQLDLRSFRRAMLEEVKGCFEHPEHFAVDSNGSKSATVVHLVSVGGLSVQDLPMSGCLQTTPELQHSPYLQAFLSCFIPPLGRVCAVHPTTTTQPSSMLYQTPAHALFYQTIHLRLEVADSQAFDLTELWTSTDPGAGEATPGFFLIIEVARTEDAVDIFDVNRLKSLTRTRLEPHQPLPLAFSQLDILAPSQVERYLSVITQICRSLLHKADKQTFEQAGQQFLQQWHRLYTRFGRSYNGEWSYQSALNCFRDTIMHRVNPLLELMPPEDRQAAIQAMDTIAFQLTLFPPAPQRINRKILTKSRQRKSFNKLQLTHLPHFDRPLFIVSAPRAGSTLLFETLAQFQSVWNTGEENHAQLESIQGLHPRDHQWHSNRLDAQTVNESIRRDVIKAFTRQLQNHEHQHFLALSETERPSSVRFVEKTPKNALRIPFIKTLFPDALFIYLHRESKSNISSLIDGWRSQRFITYRNLPGFEYRHWSFLLVPGWQEMHDHNIAEIVTRQWQLSNQVIQEDLAQLPAQDWMTLDYQELIVQPERTVQTIARFADLSWDDTIAARCKRGLPVSRLTLSAPQKNKWVKHQLFLNASPT